MPTLDIPPELKALKSLRFDELLSIDLNSVLLEDMLPGLFYVSRLARRRGTGEWTGRDGEQVAQELAAKTNRFVNFGGPREQAMLREWLHTSILRLQDRPGSDTVMAVRPLHFLTYRVDLPRGWANLRFVPDFLAVVLQQDPTRQTPATGPTAREAFGLQNPQNLLLRAFGPGLVSERGYLGDAALDRYDEETPLDIETLLCVRVVEDLAPPRETTGKAGTLSGFEPLCHWQARVLREDLAEFLRAYGPEDIPLLTLGDYVLSLLSVNLTVYFLSHVLSANHLYDTGEWRDDRPSNKTAPRVWRLGIFPDLTEGRDRGARELSRRSYARHHGQLERYLRTHLGLSLIHRYLGDGSGIPELRDLREARGIRRLEILANSRLDTGSDAHRELRVAARRELSALHEAQEAGEWCPELAQVCDELADRPLDCLVEVLAVGQRQFMHQIGKFTTSVTRKNRPGGLLMGDASGHARNGYVLSTELLEALVHRLVLRKAQTRPLDIHEFAAKLRHRYGIWIHEPPPDLGAGPEEWRAAQANLDALKERLRLLGLFRGVSDARRMQRLEPRYHPAADETTPEEGDEP